MDKDKIKSKVMNQIKHYIPPEWRNDIIAGISFSGAATWIKYVTQHFIDIGWTAAAALTVMLVNHYGKKYLIPWLDGLFKSKKK